MNSDVFLRAAKLVHAPEPYRSYRYSCQALVSVLSGGEWHPHHFDSPEVKTYEALFHPRSVRHRDDCWWGDRWGEDDDSRRECRVLALLLMHAISTEPENPMNQRARLPISDPRVVERKKRRHKVRVLGHGEYDSLKQAFLALGLSLDGHQAFRYRLKDAGDEGKSLEYKGYTMLAIPK